MAENMTAESEPNENGNTDNTDSSDAVEPAKITAKRTLQVDVGYSGGNLIPGIRV
jgi:hypothetical protein